MPIASGARGRSSVLATPSGGWTPRAAGAGRIATSRPLGGWVSSSVGAGSTLPRTAFRSLQAVHTFIISGVTKDSTGAVLPACTVDLFRTADDVFVATTTSDGSGNYSFSLAGGGTYYLVAYKAGAPDVAGTTVNTLEAI